ncbi:MAG: VOC family protein [Gemmatimonadetes bacterium]|nr:VOC family protein [Gemmatimonadota bacterium]
MPARDLSINYVEFGVRDCATTKKFYGDAFGWSFQDWGDDYVSFSPGEAGLDGGFSSDDPSTIGRPLVILYSSDLEAALAKVEAAGGKILKPIFSFPGGRRFHFADPSGNELAIWSDVGVAH